MFKNLRFWSRLFFAVLRRHKKLIIGFLSFLLLAFLIFNFSFKSIINPTLTYLEKGLFKPKLVEGVAGRVKILNPLFVSNETERDITKLVYRGLVKIDEKGEAHGDLAENWEINNDSTYIFNLKKDIKWHDGKKFSADDVIYTVNTAKDNRLNTAFKESFKEVNVKKLDDHKVKFTLKEPLASFLSILSIGIIPKHVSLEKFKPIGTGDFSVKLFNTEKLVLSNKNFDLIFKFYPTEEIAEAALKLGEIQSLGGFELSTANKNYKDWSNVKVYHQIASRRYGAVFFNTKSNLFSDKSLRLAVSYATPYEEILKEIKTQEGISSEIDMRAYPISPSFKILEGNKKFITDDERAIAVLEKAGWKLEDGKRVKDGFPLRFDLLTLNNPMFVKTATLISEKLGRLGIEVKVVPISAGEIKDRVVRKDFNALLTSQEVPSDPDQYSLWHTTQASYGNITSLSSPKVDKFLEDGRKTLNLEKRKQAYFEVEKLLLEESPVVWLYYLPYSYIITSNVEGVNLNNLQVPSDRFDSINSWKIKQNFNRLLN